MVMIISPHHDELTALRGSTLASQTSVGVHYRVGASLGGGGMAVVHYAVRCSPSGECPAVIKIMRPWFVRDSGNAASTVFRKEAVALGRLNEQVPPTPFVVRLLDMGELPICQSGMVLQLPWLALEFVHGGAEGTTLRERVESSIFATGTAFDAARAARAVDCLSQALSAINAVDVVHRDMKPDNVLCCGFASEEIFKISDFGIARPGGVPATFGAVCVGTPGYAAPEQVGQDFGAIGPQTDIFSTAAVVFHLLTGEDYFPSATPVETLLQVGRPERKSLLDCERLCPELRGREQSARGIDAALARATAMRPGDRPANARAFAAELLAWLRVDSRRIRPSELRLNTLVEPEEPELSPGWRWSVLHRPGDERIIRSVAWSGDGRCLAATSSGLEFWNGTQWLAAPVGGFPRANGVRFVRSVAPAEWLIGGDDATLAIYGMSGVEQMIQGHDPSVRYEHASGDMSDVAVIVATAPGDVPTLHGIVAKRWLRPRRLDDVAHVMSIARFSDTEWLIAGRCQDGTGFAASYDPLMGELRRFTAPRATAFLGCAGLVERNVGMVGGTDGIVAWVQGEDVYSESVGLAVPLSAITIAPGGRGWASASGRIWLRQQNEARRWRPAWQDESWTAPIVSLHADSGVVLAMTADGAILEGRRADDSRP